MLTSQEASLRGRLGALRLHATHDPRETTLNGRRALASKWEREIRAKHPDLSDEEVTRRADYAKREFYTRIAFQRHRKGRATRQEAPAT